MTEYRAGQRVRVEWPDGSSIEGVLKGTNNAYQWFVVGLGSRVTATIDYMHQEPPAITVLAEPRPEEPTGLGAVVEARAGARTQRRRWIHVGKGDWLSVMEDAREPGGFWTVRERWSDLIDPVVLSEGWTP